MKDPWVHGDILVELPARKWRRNELENYHFVITSEITNLGRDHQRMLKLLDKRLLRNIFTQYHRLFDNYKGENVPLQ